MKASGVFSVIGVAAVLLQVSCETPGTGTGTGAGAPASTAAVEVTPAPEVEKVAAVPDPPTSRQDSNPVEAAAPDPKRPKGTISQMDIGTLFELQGAGRAFVIDVRPAFFYNLDHIPGATSMPVKSYGTVFPTQRAALDAAVSAGQVIVLYCTDENCPDGRSTARKLAKEGYSTSVYTGGWKEWKASGL